jgi:ABC transporter substrate binding protein
MKRRNFIILLGFSIAKPMPAPAQQMKPSRIGFLRVGPPPPTYIGGFRQGLQEEGLLEGRDVVIEFALAKNAAQIPNAAAELARSGVDVILAAGTPSVFPARDAAGNIPVVFVATFDPVATGLVASLARPGGDVTGLTTISSDLVAKRVELIKEFFRSWSARPVRPLRTTSRRRGPRRGSSGLSCRCLASAIRAILRSCSRRRGPLRRWWWEMIPNSPLTELRWPIWLSRIGCRRFTD